MDRLERICFEMIAYAGAAKSAYMEGVETAKSGDFARAQSLLNQGDELLTQAHSPHAQLIQQEAAGESSGLTLLLVHAEDQMMGAEQFRILAEEVIALRQELAEMKKD